MFIYSSHKSLEAAQAALEDYYATGEVGDGDMPTISRSGNRWNIWVRGC